MARRRLLLQLLPLLLLLPPLITLLLLLPSLLLLLNLLLLVVVVVVLVLLPLLLCHPQARQSGCVSKLPAARATSQVATIDPELNPADPEISRFENVHRMEDCPSEAGGQRERPPVVV